MSKFVFNRDGGKTDELGHLMILSKLYQGQVALGLNVVANGSPNMTVTCNAGVGRIPTGSGSATYDYYVGQDAATTGITIATADGSNPRRDYIVGYVNKAVVPSTGVTNNSNNMFVIVAVAGTPAAVPSDPSVGQIQTAIGASNPYIILARVRVAAADTDITNSDIDDLRQAIYPMSLGDGWSVPLGTWTYLSATTMSVPLADTPFLTVGTKIKLTQTTTKYFYVVGVSGTTVTVTGGSDYTLTNATITSPYFSNTASPVGFPHWFAYTPTWQNVTVGNAVQNNRFKIAGRQVIVSLSFGLGTTTSFSGEPIATTPVTPSAIYSTSVVYSIGTIRMEDLATAAYDGTVYFLYSGGAWRISPRPSGVSGVYLAQSSMTPTQPFTWGNGDYFVGTCTYEI